MYLNTDEYHLHCYEGKMVKIQIYILFINIVMETRGYTFNVYFIKTNIVIEVSPNKDESINEMSGGGRGEIEL